MSAIQRPTTNTITSISEESSDVLSFDLPCQKVDDESCKELAANASKKWAEITLQRSSGFHEVFQKQDISDLVLQYTGEYYNCCKIAAKKHFVFCPPPSGKPNPRLSMDPEMLIPRERVLRPAQKDGGSCCYYAAKMISRRVGKKPLPGQERPRAIEKWVSDRRKAHTDMCEKLYCYQDLSYVITAMNGGSFTRNDAASFLSMNTGDASKCPIKDKCTPILQAFCRQDFFDDFASYVTDACLKARMEIDLKFLATGNIKTTPEHYYNAKKLSMEDNTWSKLSLLEKQIFTFHLANNISLAALGLKKSYWHPLQGIDSLIQELWLHGPHMVQGKFGQNYYVDDAKPLSQKIQGRIIYSWSSGSKRIDQGTAYHAVVIVGADSRLNRVYYIDPMDASDPKHEELDKIYAMSYERLKDGISNFHGARIKSLEFKPVFTKMVSKGLNEYAMHGNPRTDHL